MLPLRRRSSNLKVGSPILLYNCIRGRRSLDDPPRNEPLDPLRRYRQRLHPGMCEATSRKRTRETRGIKLNVSNHNNSMQYKTGDKRQEETKAITQAPAFLCKYIRSGSVIAPILWKAIHSSNRCEYSED
jgi:hypothetical protein